MRISLAKLVSTINFTKDRHGFQAIHTTVETPEGTGIAVAEIFDAKGREFFSCYVTKGGRFLFENTTEHPAAGSEGIHVVLDFPIMKRLQSVMQVIEVMDFVDSVNTMVQQIKPVKKVRRQHRK